MIFSRHDHNNLDVAKYIYTSILRFYIDENESQVLANEMRLQRGEAVTKLEHSNRSYSVAL